MSGCARETARVSVKASRHGTVPSTNVVNNCYLCAVNLSAMAKKRFRITESDFLLANRKASREEEIARFGKQIIFRTSTQKSKKVYDRKRLKRTDIKNTDDLPFFCMFESYVCADEYNIIG